MQPPVKNYLIAGGCIINCYAFNFDSWYPSPGVDTLTAMPYSEKFGQGVHGSLQSGCSNPRPAILAAGVYTIQIIDEDETRTSRFVRK